MNEPRRKADKMLRALSEDERIFFRNQFREARAEAQRNAEDFDGLLFAIERLGSLLKNGNGRGLGDYKNEIVALASKSSLGSDEPGTNSFDIPFGTLYSLVSRARNDALHQGAFARHLTVHATELAIILEDALMADAHYVREFMVRAPVCASTWQPLSLVRQTMLSNSFSYLPVLDDREGVNKQWMLVSDRMLARYLRTGKRERDLRMAQTLREAVSQGHVVLEAPHRVRPDDNVEKVFAAKDDGRPVLVFDGDDDGARPLLGIMMPFDVL
jgi:CBS domain-containing protein